VHTRNPGSGVSPANIPGTGGINPETTPAAGVPFTPANSPGRGGILNSGSPASRSTGTPIDPGRSTKTSTLAPFSSPDSFTASHALHPNNPNCKPAKAHNTPNAAV
jgi:hypothetical protein